MDKLLETGNTPAPKQSIISLNDTDLLKVINPIVDEQETDREKDLLIAESLVGTAERYNEYMAAPNSQRFSKESREEFIKEQSKAKHITGYSFNYEHALDARSDKDNHEMQAQRQGNWETARRGVGRALGEFAINVAETPGVIIGGIAGLATWDSSKMTENFWVKMTDAAKAELQEELPIYQKKAVTQGGVMDHMLSGAWWASEGASGVAFMGAALIPGLGLAKLPKALSITGKFARWGKSGQKVLRQLDKVAIKTGMVGAGATEAGAAAKQGINLFNATLANTVFEAGVEARMAQQAYRDEILGKYTSGEIDVDTYQKLYDNSSDVAARTFGANALLLLGPNLVMSKMMLGKGANSSAKALKKTRLNKKGLVESIGEKVTDTKGLKGFTKAGAVIGNTLKTGVGGRISRSLGRAAVNTGREGVMEEMGQMAIEKYNTAGYIEEQLTGKRTKNLLKTYLEVMGSTEGQVAALLGGILSGPMSMMSSYREAKGEKKQVDSLVTGFNSAINKFRVLKQDIYERNPDRSIAMIEDENGNLMPKLDMQKVAEVGDAKETIGYFEAMIQEAELEGDSVTAAALAENLQSQVFLPFLMEGQAGLDMLKEVLQNDPATVIALEDHNRRYGTAITKEAYVTLQMDKAKALKEDLFNYQEVHAVPLSTKALKKLGIAEYSEEDKEASSIREAFNLLETDRYVQYKASIRHIEEERRDNERKLKEAETTREKANKAIKTASKKQGISEEEQKIKAKLSKMDKLEEELYTNIGELTTEEGVEKRFKQYYDNIIRAKKINSKEVLNYLTSLITDIKKATSQEDIEKLVAKAKKEGLLLPGVEAEHLPKRLSNMLESSNINEVFGAYHILNATMTRAATAGGMSSEQFEKYRELLINAKKQITSLQEKVTFVLDNILEGATIAQEKKEKLDEEWIALNKKASKNITDIDEATASINELELKRIAAKGRKTKEHNELLLGLAKKEKEARGLLKEANKKMDSIGKEIEGLISVIAGMQDLLAVTASTIDSRDINNWIVAVIKAGKASRGTVGEGVISSIHKNSAAIKANKEISLDKMPLSVKDLMKAVEMNKNILLEHAKDLGEFILSTDELDDLKYRREELRVLRDQLENTLAIAKKVLKTFNSKSNKNSQVDLNAVLTENYQDIIAEIDKVYAELTEVDDRIKKSTEDPSAITTMISQLQSMLDAVTAIENGEYVYEKPAEEKSEGAKVTKDSIVAAMKVIKEQLNEGKKLDTSIDTLNTFLDKAIELFGETSLFVEYVRSIIKQAELAIQDPNSVSTIPDFKDFKAEKKVTKEKVKKTPKKEKTTEDAKTEINNLIKEVRNKANVYEVLETVSKEEAASILKEFNDLKEEVKRLQSDYADLLSPADISETALDLEIFSSQIKAFSKKIKEIVSGEVGIINGAPGIARLIQEIIDEKEGALQQEKIEALREEAKAQGLALQKIEDENKNVFNLQEEVKFTDGEGKRKKGNIVEIIDSENNVINVIIEDSSKKLYVVLFTNLSKEELTPQEYNDSLIQKKEDAWRAERGSSIVGGLNAVSVTVQMDRKADRVTESGEVIKNRHSFLDYLQNIDSGAPRDKSKDVIRFGINIGIVAGKAEREGSFSPERDAHTAKSREIKAVYDKVVNGGYQKLSQEEQQLAFDYLVDELPLTLRVYPTDSKGNVSKNAAAGARLDGVSKEEGNFNELDKPLRAAIIGNWLSSGAYIEERSNGINTRMSGVEANWTYLREGIINNSQVTKDQGGTKLSDLKGHSLKTLNIVAIKGPGDIYTSKATVENVEYLKQGSEGLVFLQTKNLEGGQFLLAIEQRTFADTAELDFMMSMLEEVFKKDVSIVQNTKIPDNILDKMPAGLRTAFESSKLPITYGTVFKTLITPAAEGTKYRVSLGFSEKKITIGSSEFTVETFNKDKGAIKAVLGSLKQRVSFIATNKEALTVQNEAYFEYLIESKVIYSNIPAGEPLFTGLRRKEGNKTYLDGIAPLLGPSTVKKTKIENIIEEAPVKKVEKVGKVLLSKEARTYLKIAGITDRNKIKAIPNSIKEKLNALSGVVEKGTILEVYTGLTGNESDTEKPC